MSEVIKQVLVRVLSFLIFQGRRYPADSVVEFGEGDVAVLKEHGYVDDSEAAVNYCVNELKSKVITHTPLFDDVGDEVKADAESQVSDDAQTSSEATQSDANTVGESQVSGDAQTSSEVAQSDANTAGESQVSGDAQTSSEAAHGEPKAVVKSGAGSKSKNGSK